MAAGVVVADLVVDGRRSTVDDLVAKAFSIDATRRWSKSSSCGDVGSPKPVTDRFGA